MEAAEKIDMRRVVSVEHALGWTYGRQMADRVCDRGLEGLEAHIAGVPRPARSPTGALVERLASWAALGCAVDSFGGGGGRLHPDAEEVHLFVSSLDRRVQRLLIHHARLGTVPDYMPGPAVWFEPDWRGEAEFDDAARYGADGLPKPGAYHKVLSERRQVVGCCVRRCGPGEEVQARARFEYHLWYSGLLAVSGHFCRHPHTLRDHVIMAPMASSMPWGSVGS